MAYERIERERVNLVISKELKKQAKEVAELKGISLTDFICQAISNQIAEETVMKSMPQMLDVMGKYMDLIESGVIDPITGEVIEDE